MKRFHWCLPLLIALLLTCPAPADDAHTFVIRNELGLSWPMDLTYTDFPAGTFEDDASYVVKVGTLTRPVQIETVTENGKKIDRAWFVATIAKGMLKTDGKKASKEDMKRIQAKIVRGSTESPLTLKEEGDLLVIDNGIYRFRVRKFTGGFDKPLPLKHVSHWIAGMKPSGAKNWDGKAWFSGEAMVTGARTEVLQAGPAFIDVKITYTFADTETDETAQALPMTLGKQTHKYPPNTLPKEKLPLEKNSYTAVVRFIADDPFIDINERYRFAGDAHQTLHWGKPVEKKAEKALQGMPSPAGHMPVDTAMWVRWFEYDRFGGNTSLRIVPAEEREAQAGRPFANLRPRWHQGGAGSQDFFLTSGGTGPKTNRKGEAIEKAADNYSPDNPAVGVYATFASKWVNPGGQTLHCYAEGKTHGYVELPMRNGTNQLPYGQRSYAICVGPRRWFDSTGKANSLVRRHTDWTLPAQMNKYILRWERDESKAGPHILVTREKLNKLRKQYESEKDSPAKRIMRNRMAELTRMQTRKNDLETKRKAALKLAKSNDASEKQKAAAKEEADMLKKQIRRIERRLNSDDARILKLIVSGEGKAGGLPKADLWIWRRYQDDFLNPTGSPTRRIKGVGEVDLYAGGKPQGDAWFAAMGYIHSDLDQWPGWHNGWSPGNPNFHTDKYMVAVYVAAAMLDHPHAKEWLDFGYSNFQEDLDKVLFAPDGVGWECPGYSGYSFSLQQKIAKIFQNVGYGNPVADNPLTKKTGIWHRKLLTPIDARIGFRHEAPHGDTHRWTSGMKSGFGKLAAFYAKKDPTFASEMAGTWQMLRDMGYSGGGLKQALIDMDPTIQPMSPEKMDFSSEQFYGFGAILRSGYGTDRETFCSIKAGPARGHYHNDELAYHYYAGNTPISLDYNCSYHPRADHAALHNSMTFGKEGPVKHNARNEQVNAHEQIWGTAHVGAFGSSPAGDAVVAERTGEHLSMRPIDPHDHEFSRGYPSRKVDPITHRRFLVMVKHPAGSKLSDYLVLREETTGSEPQQLNVHLLARDAKIDGNTVKLDGQLDKDMIVKVLTPAKTQIQQRSYYYAAGHGGGGFAYAIKPGETMDQWTSRLRKMMADSDADCLPIGEEKEHASDAEWAKRIKETDGKALIVPPFWTGRWTPGEYQVWLRVQTAPAEPITWMLYPYKRGSQQPTIEKLAGGKGVRVTLGDQSEEIYLATDPADNAGGQAVIKRDGKTHVLLNSDTVGELGTIPHKPLKK
ncbi:MAG: hypothetical protein ACLFVU_12620 [Phycisphaerae bacterium]